MLPAITGLNALTSLTGGGALTSNPSAKSGDASAGLNANTTFSYSGAVASGSASQSDSGASTATAGASSQLPLYLAIGAGFIAVGGFVFALFRGKRA